MTADDEFTISPEGTSTVEAKFFGSGNLRIEGTLVQGSDENSKTAMTPADTAAVLEALAELDISTWAYKTEPEVTHLGPTAQSFASAFDIGGTETGIASVDADGVALAAIQALNEKLVTENGDLRSRLAQCEARLATLEAALDDR
jgi:D-tyrosyl-tRNA(Tyr) deacylase